MVRSPGTLSWSHVWGNAAIGKQGILMRLDINLQHVS